MEKCVQIHEWVSSSSTTLNIVPIVAAAIHLICCSASSSNSNDHKLSFSTRPMVERKYRQEAQNQLIQQFLNGLPPQMRISASSTQIATTQLIPYTLNSLFHTNNNPLTRPVSSIELLTPTEQVAFQEHVHKLRSLNLTYVHDNNNDNHNHDTSTQKEMRLEPNIEKIVFFPNLQTPPQRTEIPLLVSKTIFVTIYLSLMQE